MSILKYFQKAPSVAEVPPSLLQEPEVPPSSSYPCTDMSSSPTVVNDVCPEELSEEESIDETSDCIPPAAKRASIESAQECRDVARYVGSSMHIADAETSCLLTISNHKLTTSSQGMLVGMLFSIVGCNCILASI